MLDILVKGGPVMIFIGICALASGVIIIERLLYFASIKKEYAALIPNLQKLISENKFREAEALCAASFSPLAKLTKRGLECFHKGDQFAKETIQFAASREIQRFEHFIPALETIANISTLLGLLGTVSGNIQAFGILADSGIIGNPSLLAGAIAEALITTAAGLIVSIPTSIFHNYFVTKANYFITETESSMGELLLLMKNDDNIDAV
jgi:biopolymer transport protein ExbB